MTNLQEIIEQLRQTPKEQRPEVLSQLKSQLGIKLDEKALEIAGLSEGRGDENILDYLAIAEQQGLTDAAYLLREKVFEIGKAQIEATTAPIRERKRREQCLEDFLVRDNNLTKIEPGLKYVARQDPLQTGFIDIRARDTKETDVLIELKTAADPVDKIDFQLTKYLEENPRSRLILVTPSIDSSIYRGFRGRYGERVKFVQMQEKEGSYSFKEITPEDADKMPKKRRLKFKKANGTQSGVISFVKKRRAGPVYEKPKAQERQPAERRAETERESPTQEVSGLPVLSSKHFFYKMLLATTKDPEKCIDLTQTPRKSLKALINLTCQSNKELDAYVNYINWFKNSGINEEEVSPFGDLTSQEFKLFYADTDETIDLPAMGSRPAERVNTIPENGMFERSLKKIHSLYTSFWKLKTEFASIEQEEPDSDLDPLKLNRLEQALRETKMKLGEIKYRDKGLSEFRDYIKQAMVAMPESADFSKLELFRSNFLEMSAALSFMSTKLAATRELHKINKKLGAAYLRAGFDFLDRYSVSAERAAKEFEKHKSINTEISAAAHSYRNFEWCRRDITDRILRTNLLLSTYEDNEDTAPRSSESEQGNTTPQSNQSQTPQNYSPLVQAITQNHNGELFTKDNLARIKYFAEDLATRVDYGIPEDKRQELTKSFQEFRLDRRLRHKEERPDDSQLRTFFDYVTEAVYKSKQAGNVLVPTAKDLDKMYNKAKESK